MHKLWNWITLGTLLMLAACASVPGSEAEMPKGVVVEHERSGGFAGLEETWTVYGDGRVTYKQGEGEAAEAREWTVEPEQVQALLSRAEELGFFKMEADYTPLDTCCDRFTYKVTVNGASASNTVTTIDAAKEAPEALWQLIDEVNRLVEE